MSFEGQESDISPEDPNTETLAPITYQEQMLHKNFFQLQTETNKREFKIRKSDSSKTIYPFFYPVQTHYSRVIMVISLLKKNVPLDS